MNFLKRISCFSCRAVYLIYLLFSLLVLRRFIFVRTVNFAYTLTGFFLLCTLGTLLLRGIGRLSEVRGERAIFITLLCLCSAVKLAWVLTFKIEPRSDYEMFYMTAVNLSKGFFAPSRYVALFPHIMGYSLFLSVFIKIFGANYMVAPLVNVFLSVASLALLYFICRKLLGMKAAVIACVLWILLPSQTIYNMFALSEPFYSTELLLIWALIISVDERFEKAGIPRIALYSAALALLLAFLNMARPIAAIPIIALVIWLLIIDAGRLEGGRILLKKAVCVLTVLICFLIFDYAADRYVEARLGEEPATVPGYSIYVGLNAESGGVWNKEDSERLYEYDRIEGLSAGDVQHLMLRDAFERLKSGEINFPKLMLRKFATFLGDDSSAVSYAGTRVPRTDTLRSVCNAFYYFLIAASGLGVCFLFRTKDRGPVFMICIYFVGLTLAQMLVEVAGRYHYSLTLSLVVLAAYGISGLGGGARTLPINGEK